MKKRKLFLALALAGACAFALTSCGGGDNASTTSGNIVTTTSGDSQETSQGDYKYYALNLTGKTIQTAIFGIKKEDNKLSEITFLGGEVMAYLIPDFKDNKVVGLKLNQIAPGRNLASYYSVGDDFANNIANDLLFKTENNNLIFSIYGKEIIVGFDGSSSSTDMTEIALNKEIELGGTTLKITGNSFEASDGSAKSIITKTESGAIYEGRDSNDHLLYKMVSEREGNILNQIVYYSPEDQPNQMSMITRFVYDSNDRIIRESEYYISQYGFYPNTPSKYHYNDKGQLISIDGSSSSTFEYDSYGRIIKQDSSYESEETEYNDKGLRASVLEIYKYSYFGTSKKTVYEYDSNNMVSKETYYPYDTETKTLSTIASGTKTYTYNDTGYVATTNYADGTKSIQTYSNTSDKFYNITETYDSSNNLIDYLGDENVYENGEEKNRVIWDFADGKKYKRVEETIETSGNTKTDTYYSINSDGTYSSDSYKNVYTYENGYFKSSVKYAYDITAKAFSTTASETEEVTRDKNNNVIKTEKTSLNSNKAITEYVYDKDGTLTNIIMTNYSYNSGEYIYSGKSEKVISNDFITAYKEYKKVGNNELVKLESQYNKFCDKTTERYNYYDDNEELTDTSYGYDYTYNEIGDELSFKSLKYNATTKKFDIVSSENTYEYDKNYNLIKETNKRDGTTITLENTYNSDGKISSQIRKVVEGETTTQYKYVQDYVANTTASYEYKNNSWELIYTYEDIRYLSVNMYS